MRIYIRSLKIASLLFLVIPVFVFLLSWVKIWISIPVSLALLGAIWQYTTFLKRDKESIVFSVYHIIGILIIGILWASLSGIGGFGILMHDNFKLYSIIKDVMENPWPVEYTYEGQHYYLSAYLSYYITAPVLVGWISYDAVNIFQFIYASSGIFISLIWFAILSRNKLVFGAIFFILIGGFDIAGFLFQNGVSGGLEKIWSGEFIQFYWWNSLDINKYLLYHGNTNLLFWAPAHSIPCWVASGLFFYDYLVKKDLTFSPIYLFSLVSWSPFILIGLFPYFLYLFFKTRTLDFLKLQNFLIIPAFFILIWFVTSVSVTDLDKGFVLLPIESFKGLLKNGFQVFWFVFFEVLIWFAFVKFYLNKKDWQENKVSLILLLLVLLCIPLYRLGKYNDWVQRVSMPSLFLLWIYVLRAFDNIKGKVIKFVAIILLLLGASDSIAYLKLSYELNGLTFDYHPLPYEEIKPLPETAAENDWVVDQYAAKGEPSFFKYIAKQKKVLE